VIDRHPYRNICIRNYEVDLGDVALPLERLLDPVGVKHRQRPSDSSFLGVARLAGGLSRREDALIYRAGFANEARPLDLGF